jgi:hypothetical protein
MRDMRSWRLVGPAIFRVLALRWGGLFPGPGECMLRLYPRTLLIGRFDEVSALRRWILFPVECKRMPAVLPRSILSMGAAVVRGLSRREFCQGVCCLSLQDVRPRGMGAKRGVFVHQLCPG